MSKAITESSPERPRPDDAWQGAKVAPSALRTDDFGAARAIGLASAGAVIFGGLVLVLDRWFGRPNAFIGSGWATVWLTLGLVGLLFHASVDRDYNYRRLYLFFGLAALALGAFLCILPYPKLGDQFGTGYLFLGLSLLFVLAPLHNEDDPQVRTMVQIALAGVGGLMAVLSMLGGALYGDFLLPTRGEITALPFGLLLAPLGLIYLTAAVSSRGTSDPLGYALGLGIGAFGALVFLIGLGRSFFPSPTTPFTWNLLLIALGLLYALVSVALCSDNRLVVMTRRELAAFFFSPMAYFVLLGFTFAQWLGFFMWISEMEAMQSHPRFQGIEEPIVRNFLIRLAPIISIIFVVPALTMRLVSEERRSGTMEVMLTSPVDEVTVVMSKFLAALIMYVVMWIPCFLFLLALRVVGGKDFDYHPILSFSLALLATGAMFVSMGLFFSSLTRNQVVAGVLTFAGMLALLLIYVFESIVRFQRDPSGANQIWTTVLEHMSFVDFWVNTLQGRLVARAFLFPLSMTVMWLFLSVKVLEGRKWT